MGNERELRRDGYAGHAATGSGNACTPGKRTLTQGLPVQRKAADGEGDTAKPRREGLTYEQAWQKIEWAYVATLPRHNDLARAASLMQEVADWLKHLSTGKNIAEHFHGKSGAMDQSSAIVGIALTNVKTTLYALKHMKGGASRGQWKVTLDSVKAAKPWLVTLGDETAFDDNKLLVELESATRSAYYVHAAIASLPAVLALGAYAAPIIAEEISLMGGQALINFALTKPILATEVAMFATGMALTIGMSGGLKEWIEQLRTEEGQGRFAQDLIVLLDIIITHQPRQPRARSGAGADDIPAPSPPSRARVHADVESIEGDQIRARVSKIETTEREATAAQGGTGAATPASKPAGEHIDREMIPKVDKPLPANPKDGCAPSRWRRVDKP